MDRKEVERVKNLIIRFHEDIIEKSGGEKGIRDEGGIDYISYKLIFLNKKKDVLKIAEYILKSLARNHYFLDGNKRISFIFTKMILMTRGYHLRVSYKQALSFLLDVADYNQGITDKEILKWLSVHIEKIPDYKIKNYLREVYYGFIYEKEEKD